MKCSDCELDVDQVLEGRAGVVIFAMDDGRSLCPRCLREEVREAAQRAAKRQAQTVKR